MLFSTGHLLAHKWENAFSLDKFSWGFRRNMNISDILTINQVLKNVVSTVSCGGERDITQSPKTDT